MPAAEERRLVDEYRSRQQALSSIAVRDLVRLVEALFDLTGPGLAWTALKLAVKALIRDRRQQAADVAGAYYVAIREAAGAPGGFTPPPPLPLDDGRLDASLDEVGLDVFDRAVRAGASPGQARDRMAITIGGRAAYLTLDGGRQVMEGSTTNDPEAIGWIRVTDADPCAWCAMLASRGAVYKSAETAGHGRREKRSRDFEGPGEFKYHDYDMCHAVPIFHEDHPFQQHAEDLYDQWKRETAGESGAGARNAWRRYWDNRNSADQGA